MRKYILLVGVFFAFLCFIQTTFGQAGNWPGYIDRGTITPGDNTYNYGSQDIDVGSFEKFYACAGVEYYFYGCSPAADWDVDYVLFDNSNGTLLHDFDGVSGCATWSADGDANASNRYTSTITGTIRVIMPKYNRSSSNSGNSWNWNSSATVSTQLGIKAISPATPDTPTGGGTICSGGSLTLTRSGSPAGAGITWYWQTSASGTSTGIGSGTTYTASPAGTTTYYVRPRTCNGYWGTASSGVTVTVAADPVAPTATKSPNEATVCEGQTLTLTGVTDNGGGTGTCNIEYSINGGSYSTTPASFSATVGTNTISIRKTCNGSGCGSSTVTSYSWTVVADPSISISGGSGPVCSDAGGTFGTLSSSVSGGTGTQSYQWQRNINGGGWTNVGTAATYNTGTVSTAGTYQYRCVVSVSGSHCASATSNTLSFVVDENPTITAPSSVCDNATATVTTNVGTISVSSGSWSGGTFTPPNIAAPTASQSVTITATNGACTETQNITVYNTPSFTSSSSSMCQGETRTLTSDITGATFSGTGVSGTTFTAPNPGGTSANYILTVTNGSCTSQQVITVYGVATITSSSAAMCQGGTRTLTASLPGGIFSGTGVSGTAFTAPTPSGLSQTYTITYTTPGSPCSSATQNIIVSAQPTASAGGSQTICVGGTATVSGASSTNGAILWTHNGGGSISGETTLTPTYTSTAADVGNTVTLTMTVSNTPCTPATATYTVNVVADPVAPTATKSPNVTTVCEGQTLTLTGVTDNGGGTGTCNIEYSINGGSYSTTPASFSATVGTNTIAIRKTCSGSDCGSSTATSYSWTVVADPSITTQPTDETICLGGSATFSAAATGGTPSLTYQWQYNNGGTWGNVTNGTPLGSSYSGATTTNLGISGILIANDYDYRLVASASGNDCGDAISDIATLTINPTTVSGTASAVNSPICETDSTDITLSGHTGSIIRWEIDDNITFSSPATIVSTSTTINSGTLTSGTHYFRAVVGSGTCPQLNSIPATVEVDEPPSVAYAGTDKLACLKSAITMDANNPSVGTGTWSWAPSSLTYVNGTDANDYNAEIEFNSSNIYTGIWEITNGVCPSTTDTVIIKVNTPDPIVMSDAVGSCVSGGENAWMRIYDTNGDLIASVNDYGAQLGDVTVTEYYHGGAAFEVPASSGGCGTQFVLNRSFVINSTIEHGLPRGVRLYFTDAELNDLINRAGCGDPNGCEDDDDVCSISDLMVTQIGGASNEDGTFTLGDGVATLHSPTNSGMGNVHFGANYVQFDVTAFSEFWIHGSEHGVALPVELTKFEAISVDNKYIQLAWETATEINNEGFEVERSTDGVEFTNIEFVKGNGNSTNIHNYSLKDVEVSKNVTYYYRLKQLDYDGKFDYSGVVSAELGGKEDFSIGDLIPNPSKEYGSVRSVIYLEGSETITISIYNTIGVKVSNNIANLESGFNEVSIATENLSSGTYFINFEGSFGRETKKLVVVR